jgi:enoyl-CoA hydratase
MQGPLPHQNESKNAATRNPDLLATTCVGALPTMRGPLPHQNESKNAAARNPGLLAVDGSSLSRLSRSIPRRETRMAEGIEIICDRQGSAGVVILSRPQALNALTLNMVRELRRALDAWVADPAVTRVIVTGAGEKAFCAGGDIRRLYELGRARQYDEALTFWREEYELNILIKNYPKPYVSLIDGIVMGGGVGVSLHGKHRVAGERYLFAMPEVGIGFFPDVGASYALPRLPGETGLYIALTGERVRTADALALGLATHAARSGALSSVREAIIAGEPIDPVLAEAAFDPGPAHLDPHRDLIDDCFSGSTVVDILEALDGAARSGSEFAARTAATMRSKSPTSLAITLEQMRRGRTLTFEEAMRMEYRIVSRVAEGHDFYEGVRATLIDKDGQPRWRPERVEDIEPGAIQRYFADLGPRELRAA